MIFNIVELQASPVPRKSTGLLTGQANYDKKGPMVESSKLNISELQNSTAESSTLLSERRLYLEGQIEKLRFICDRLNPYEQIPDYLKKELRAVGLSDLLDGSYDPFALTNKLLLLMENALEELELYKNA